MSFLTQLSPEAGGRLQGIMVKHLLPGGQKSLKVRSCCLCVCFWFWMWYDCTENSDAVREISCKLLMVPGFCTCLLRVCDLMSTLSDSCMLLTCQTSSGARHELLMPSLAPHPAC
jgi:hypothetical protein